MDKNYVVRFSVVKKFEAKNEDDVWHQLKTFWEDNDCMMPQGTVINLSQMENGEREDTEEEQEFQHKHKD